MHMPIDLSCRKCNFSISLSWSHFDFDFDYNGYGSTRSFACAKCGTTHYIEHPTNENLQSYLI